MAKMSTCCTDSSLNFLMILTKQNTDCVMKIFQTAIWVSSHKTLTASKNSIEFVQESECITKQKDLDWSNITLIIYIIEYTSITIQTLDPDIICLVPSLLHPNWFCIFHLCSIPTDYPC